MPESVDLIVMGAGIVGLATARSVHAARPDLRVVVLDKEHRVGAHQTGHNSGVLHSGVYYPPGSLKASLVAEGRAEMLAYCRRRGLHLDVCGKVIVATDTDELRRLGDLAGRADANGVPASLLGPNDLRGIEPHVAGLGALHVPSAAIVDFGEVAQALSADLGPDVVQLGEEVSEITSTGEGLVVETSSQRWGARAAVNCAGLHADVLARVAGAQPDVRIVPFRGEYLELVPSRRHLVRNLVYPVPDPQFPFLGVHFTRMVDGSVHAGPNAVLSLAREGYRWRDVDPSTCATWRAPPACGTWPGATGGRARARSSGPRAPAPWCAGSGNSSPRCERPTSCRRGRASGPRRSAPTAASWTTSRSSAPDVWCTS